MLLQLYGRLAKRHQVSAITAALDDGSRPSVEHINGIKVTRLKTRYIDLPGLPLPFMRMEGVREAIIREKAEIYHINNRFVFYNGTLKAIKDAGGKLALTIHNALPKNIDMLTDTGGLVYDIVMGRRTMAAADLIVTVSKSALHDTVPVRMRGKATTIYNGINSSMFAPARKGDANVARIRRKLGGGRIILNNGRLTPQKGQVYLLRAMHNLREKGAKDVSLTIIGRGPLQEWLESKAAALGIRDRVRIVSGIPEEELPYYYNAADVFAFTSLYEPCAMALLEAMASGMPIATTRAGGNPELARDAALYIRERDPADTAEKAMQLLSDRKGAARLGRLARSYIVKHHNWDNIARQYEDAFEGVLRG